MTRWIDRFKTPSAGSPAQAPRWLLAAVAAAVLAGCASSNPAYDPSQPHHLPNGFRNLHASPHGEPEGGFWAWQWQRLRADLPADRPERVARVPVDLTRLQRPTGDLTFTWLGHSSALWQVNGLQVMTDPHLSERASPVSFAGPKRLNAPPISFDQLPRIDVVLISHNHYDHLDLATVQRLAAQPGGSPLFVVPLGVGPWMADQGITRVKEMDWWQRAEIPAKAGAVTVTFVPSHHWSSRTPWDRSATLWGGFVMQAQMAETPVSVYYAGDTGYAQDFVEIGQRFGGFDFSMIPVGCYEPRWFMRGQHVNEDEAVRIHRDVRSRQSIGVHWGVFRLCDDPVDAPLDGLPAALDRAQLPREAFVLPTLGETRLLRAAVAPSPGTR